MMKKYLPVTVVLIIPWDRGEGGKVLCLIFWATYCNKYVAFQWDHLWITCRCFEKPDLQFSHKQPICFVKSVTFGSVIRRCSLRTVGISQLLHNGQWKMSLHFRGSEWQQHTAWEVGNLCAVSCLQQLEEIMF